MTARVALRLVRRGAGRSKARTALILAMITIPVALLTWIFTMYAQPNVSRGTERPLGRADGIIWGGPDWDVDAQEGGSVSYSGRGNPFTAAQVADLLGAGSRVIPYGEGSVRYLTPYGYHDGEAVEVDLNDSMAQNIVELRSGRLPARAGEAVATEIAGDQGIRVGTTVYQMPGRVPVKIVGLARNVGGGPMAELVAYPGSMPVLGPQAETTYWMVDAPAPITLAKAHELNAEGAIVDSPAVAASMDTVAIVVDSVAEPAPWIVLLFLLVVLAAGPAFAVGRRRRAAQFALMAVQGATPRQLWRIAMADGLVFGLIASLAGAVAGIAAAAALRHQARAWFGTVSADFTIPWAFVVAVVVFGVGAGLVAALAPAARAARTDPIAVLGGHRAAATPTRRWTVAGAVLVILGGTLAVVLVRHSAVLTMVAALIALLGLIALVPAVVAGVAAAGSRLPLPLRFAVRDAARNPGRSTPAVAAVMTVVTVVTAVGVLASTNLRDWRSDTEASPQGPPGALVIRGGDLTPELWGRIRQMVASALPAGVPLIEAGAPATGDNLPLEAAISKSEGELAFGGGVDPGRRGGLLVGDERLLRYVLRRDDPAAAAALREGRAVVLDPSMVRGGGFQVILSANSAEVDPVTLKLPALATHATGPGWARAVVSPSTLVKTGLKADTVLLLVDPADYRVPDATLRVIADRLAQITPKAEVVIPTPDDRALVLFLVLIAAALVLSMTFLATALAAVEARPDLAIMSAMGAGPFTKRAVVAAQALTVALVGSALGAVAGLGIGVATMLASDRGAKAMVEADGVSRAVGAPPIEVPWTLAGLLVVGLPLAAALLAGAVSRSRLPLPLRAAA
ncbi:ABC transporter permease [Streptosporangiaceae bacterium NEAU-GS5]|nr:ABC transporter permease [Streptosporangiaceae bacterium NEAU-GS5]